MDGRPVAQQNQDQEDHGDDQQSSSLHRVNVMSMDRLRSRLLRIGRDHGSIVAPARSWGMQMVITSREVVAKAGSAARAVIHSAITGYA